MRAGLLAHANDLMPAAQHVVPGLVAFRRGLIRVLGTAVGQSGSGPTAWVLYPSLDEAEAAADAVRDALADGRVVAPGQGSPVVHATRLLLDPSAGSAGTGEGGFTREPRSASPRRGPGRPRPVQPRDRVGGLVFCSGQLGLDPATNELVDGVEAQAERSLRNLRGGARAAGLGLADVAKTTVFLADMADFATVNAVYGRFFPSRTPARSTVQVAALPKGGRVEIEAIAAAGVRRVLDGPARPPIQFLTTPMTTDAGSTVAVILAAGLGTRMRSRTPKVLHAGLRPADARVRHRRRGAGDRDRGRSSSSRPRPRRSASGSRTTPTSRSRTSRAARVTRFVRRWTPCRRTSATILVLSGDVPLVDPAPDRRARSRPDGSTGPW